jgi:predicted O-linked N-acetylglucosamine transferase (SPINDLY family)
MYRRMGIAAATASDSADYVRAATGLGRDADRRQALRREILERNDVLFEDIRVIGEFSRFFREAAAWN